jgi:hypothetical protein
MDEQQYKRQEAHKRSIKFVHGSSPMDVKQNTSAHEMQQAERAAAEDILNEGLRNLPNAETLPLKLDLGLNVKI